MNENYIAVFDSGVGGLTVLHELKKKMPYENFIYISDSRNVPYGLKSKERLIYLTLNGIAPLSGYNLKALVLGCNTLSVTVRQELQDYCNYPVFGVFPPVEKQTVNAEKTLLLATPNTVKAYKNVKGLTCLSLPDLATDVERNALNLKNVNLLNHLPNRLLFYKRFSSVVLGCTHYNLLKNEILNHFCPEKIVSGVTFTASFVSNCFKNTKPLGNSRRNEILFLGNNADYNKKVYRSVVENSQNL